MSDSFTGVNRLSLLQGIFPTQGSNSSLPHGRRILYQLSITLPTKIHLVKDMFFSSSHVWMWELDHKESWAQKNWCFWTVVLEKTLERPLDYKEIKPVTPKGNQFSSVQFNPSVMSNSLWPHELQHTRPPCPSPIPGIYSNSCPLSRWCHPAISLSSPSPPAPNPSQHHGLFQWVTSLHEVAKVLEFQLQHQFFQWTPWTGLLHSFWSYFSTDLQ